MFQFKKFTIVQDKTAMKVGTDGVLLGAWAPLTHQPRSVLDIGTGTGLIALMLAQRSSAEQIDAFEIDADAYEQSVDNFEQSPWSDRLFCFHAGIDEFIEEPEEEYDLIVSNPPFHSEDFFSEDEKRNRARFSESLPFEDLVEAADLLLSKNGVFAVILPFVSEEKFISLASDCQLYPMQIMRVKGTPTSEIKRSLMAFSRTATDDIPVDELVIETARHEYTPEYIALTKAFYLKM